MYGLPQVINIATKVFTERHAKHVYLPFELAYGL